MFVYNSNRVNAVVWAATIRWLLDWMEQLTNAVSGCHAVARFRFFLLFYSFYIHTNEIARTRITGCLLHVRLCCSLCKHSFWNARGNENIDAITFAICAAKESTRPPQFINLFRTQTPFGAWKSEREWNERRKHLLGLPILFFRAGLSFVGCSVPVMAHAFVYLRQVHTFHRPRGKIDRFMCLLNSNQKILPIGGCDKDKPSVR